MNTQTTDQLHHYCITRPDQEEYVKAELSALAKDIRCESLQAGVVQVQNLPLENLFTAPLFFSLQLLPHTELREEASVKTISAAVAQRIIETLSDGAPPWQLHVFHPKTSLTGTQYNRAHRIEEEVLELLKQKRRSILRARAADSAPAGPVALVQVVTLDDNRTLISVIDAERRKLLRARISPSLGGYTHVPDDLSPPSRAHKKLREALTVFDLRPRHGESCVDLGASPGGWTAVMLEHGCRVTAVDRSPLSDALMKNRRVNFIEGNALTWIPRAPVDWMVCDVIASPQKSIALLERWVTQKLCRFFCVTIKFKGVPDLNALATVQTLLQRHAVWFDGRQLTHNKNEVTVVGRAR